VLIEFNMARDASEKINTNANTQEVLFKAEAARGGT